MQKNCFKKTKYTTFVVLKNKHSQQSAQSINKYTSHE